MERPPDHPLVRCVLVVSAALDPQTELLGAVVPKAAGVAVRPMVAIVGAEWGFFARPYEVRGVWVGWPKEAAKVVGRPGPLGAGQRQRLAEVLMARLPMA